MYVRKRPKYKKNRTEKVTGETKYPDEASTKLPPPEEHARPSTSSKEKKRGEIFKINVVFRM
jgi:hypothetical protein